MKPFLDGFGEMQARFRAFWRMENRRPLIHARLDTTLPPPAAPGTAEGLEAWHLDAREVFRRARAQACGGCYPGIAEEFPFYFPFAPYPAFFGAEPVFMANTIWHRPMPESEDFYGRIAFREDNPWWRKSVAMYRELVDLADGHFFLSIPTFWGPLDALEGMRGSTGLCLDLVDRAEEVLAAQSRMLEAWRRHYDVFQGILASRFDGGATSFLPIWCPGRGFCIQCDFSGMLSEEMFDRFVAPEVEAQAAWVDYAFYHLDGPGAARHAERLVRIPRLHGIQWQKGANGGPTLRWLPLLQRIQRAGKRILVDGSPEEIEELSRKLEPQGLFLATSFRTRADAEEFMRRLERRFGACS
ncbi:MAG TPA: hypothetical protein P5137_08215 [Candidatus Brocadiia bacterium]|nr:hypothetical protein [Candidatus Brocadiia bacterium]